MKRNRSVMVRLNDVEMAKLDALCLGGSREGYFRNILHPLAEQRARLHELAIESFRQSARAKVDDGEDASEYLELIAKWDAEIDILRRRAE